MKHKGKLNAKITEQRKHALKKLEVNVNSCTHIVREKKKGIHATLILQLKEHLATWHELTKAYFLGRPALAHVFLLVGSDSGL